MANPNRYRLSPAFIWGFIALCVYIFIAGETLRYPSIAPYYLQLAEALTHGETAIEPSVNIGYDLIQFQQRWYVAQQPLPAILMMPLAAVLGVEHVSDTAIQILVGALNVALCSLTLSTYLPKLNRWQHGSVVLLFAFGTVHASVTTIGGVWFFGHITAVTFMWLYLIALRWNHTLWMGLCVGLVLLARPSVVPALMVLSLAWLWQEVKAVHEQKARFMWRSIGGLILGLLPAVLFLGTYNGVRFGQALNFGYEYLVDAALPHAKRLNYGMFHPNFLPENLYIAFIEPISFRAECLVNNGCGVITTDLGGAGLLWTSPLLFAALFARPLSHLSGMRLILIAVAAVLALLPALLYHNTGAAQFGYRFLLDALPLLILLVAAASQRIPRLIWIPLLIYCIAINLWGAEWLINALVYGRG
jgi:hypothetical protein